MNGEIEKFCHYEPDRTKLSGYFIGANLKLSNFTPLGQRATAGSAHTQDLKSFGSTTAWIQLLHAQRTSNFYYGLNIWGRRYLPKPTILEESICLANNCQAWMPSLCAVEPVAAAKARSSVRCYWTEGVQIRCRQNLSTRSKPFWGPNPGGTRLIRWHGGEPFK